VLAAQGVAMVYLGTQYVKVVPAKDAPMEAGPVVELPPDQLPDSSSFLSHVSRALVGFGYSSGFFCAFGVYTGGRSSRR